jgi:RNA polymerase sigma-70 factor (ECF subfamily)
VAHTRDRELFDLVYACMRALAGSHASDLDDLVQVAAEEVFRKLPTFEGRSSLRTWVYAVCYRVLLKHRRWYRRWSARFRLQDEGDFAAPDTDCQLPNQQLELRERASVLQTALSRLTELQRAVVVLHDLEELDIAEVAIIVDCNVLTARSRLRDGRTRLRRLIEADRKFTWGDRHGVQPPRK